MAIDLITALRSMKTMNNAPSPVPQSPPGVSPDQVNAAIQNGQKQLIYALRTNPDLYLKRMTGTGK